VRRRRWRALVRNELLLIRRDPGVFIGVLVMPLLLMVFLKPSARALLQAQGMASANGSEQAVPGGSVLFGIFLLGTVGTALLRDEVWKTSDRLRLTGASSAEILAAKVLPMVPLVVGQQLAFFTAGYLTMGMRPAGDDTGALFALVLVATALACFVVSVGSLLASVVKSIPQLVLGQVVLSMFLAGLGGALTPIAYLPRWLQGIANATPGHWAMEGYRAAIDGRGARGALSWSLALTAASVGIGIASATRYRRREAISFT